MKKFKYTKYDYSIINPYINLPKDYTIKNIELIDNVIHLTVLGFDNDITIKVNAKDLV